MVFIKHRIFATSLFVLFLKVAAYTPWITEASETHNSDFTSDNTSREAIDFLKYGENVVKLNNSIDDVTLVFGDSGDGTTTLVQWLATDGGNLSAVKNKKYPFYYYIADGNKIRNSSHISKTKFPELVVDENANIAFYDFPGFKEVQSPKDELAAKYFIQKVIDHVECVKIILVMSQRGSRNQCINFMKRVTHFVRNIEKFQNSIAIVVTKVNTSSKEIVDEEIFKMGEFFETKVKNHLKSQNDTKIIPLIDILTQKTNNNYSRIGIFPKPKESGPLSKRNLYLIRYKQFIQKIIQEMECTPKDDNFYPLSINNKTFINHLTREIVKNIANDMKKEYIELIEKMDRKIASFTNINNYRRTRENITVSKDFRDKMMKIDDEFRTQSVDIINKYDSKNEASYLKFLNVLHIPSLNDYFTQIANDLKTRKEVLMKDVDEGFQKIINNTAFNINIIGREIYEYYESHMKFTLGYKQAVSELNQLKNILNYFEEPQNESQNILELSNQMRETIDKLNIDIRTRETINDKIVDLQYMHNQTTFFTNLNPNINLTYNRFSKPFENTIKDLNDLQTWYEFLSDLYTNRDEISENAATALSYRNDFMFSQEIKQVSTKYKYNLGELDESKLEELEQIVLLKTPADKKPCSKEYDYEITGYNIKLSDYIQFNDTLECANGGKIKTVKIFAVNMIIIDVDLRATQTQLQVIIIAQKWNIDGKREIVLNGAPPDAKLSKTNNCIFPHGIDGNNGEPGLPGKPGGHFIGIGETFINGNLLTISVDGGNGSAGQDGENGCPGKNGEPAKLPQGFFGKSLHEGNFTEAIKPYDIDINEMPSEIANATYFRINGTKGGEGGKGGNGGKGGKGGYEGSVEIIYLDNRLHNIVQVSAKKGNAGKGGKGGDGGSGGINGDGTIIEYLPGVVTYQIKMVPSNTTAPKGPNGENDSYEAGIREPEKLSSPPTIATITNQYNQFLKQRLKNMKNKKINNFIKDFYTKLNSNITKSYDILHMIQEFYDLENQLPEINEQDSLPFYETLLNKIEGYRLQLNDEENSILKYLNDTVSSKIHNLKENTSPTLITNISQYLERIEENIKIIRAFQERNSRHTAIKEYKNEYKKNITKGIEDLENLINKIAEEFEEINRQMDEHIDKIIKEITELKKDHGWKQNELNTKRIELQRILISKGILKITNTTQQIFGITKNKKQNVGGLMQIMNEKTESRLLSKDEILEHITNGIKKNKINNLKKCLNTMLYEKLRVHEDQFTNIIKVMNNTSKKLRGTRNYDELTFKTVIDLEDDLKKALKEKESEIKLHNKSKEALSILKDISCNILTSSLPFNIYDENNQNQNSLDEISKAINDDNTIQNLERYEKFFFKLIVDVLERTRVEFKNAINKLDSKLLVSSVEYKWRIQAFLKYIQSEIQELSSEKYDTSMLKNYLQKLNNAMTTLVNVYDCITRYKEQETLMEYIADIISLAIKSTTVNNATLSEALGKLEISMISNLILKEHKLLMTSFIQWVFPFADHFLRNFTSPSRFKVENNIQNLICIVMEQEKSLLSKLRTYKSSLGIYDKFINYEEFDSNGTSTKPFYVWKNEERNREISYLLGGKSIKLYADIRRSFAEKYAIKFNTISIHFKSKNQMLQPKIDKELEKFELRIVHSGDSYYRYGDKFYKISSGNTYKIRHSLEKNSQGEWKSKNQVYTKIKDGDIILSPYTVWQMQLTPHEGYNFDELSSYKNEVDLELIGTGSFINEIFDLQLEKYYKEFSERE